MNAPWNSKRIRSDFPILSRMGLNNHPLVYLDNAATTQKPGCVIEAVASFYREWNANVHRSAHNLAEGATLRFEEARKRIAAFIGAPEPQSVIFTRGATDSINMAAHGWGAAHIGRGDVILLTPMEHHSNLVPWQQLAQQRGATLRFIPLRKDATLDMEALEGCLDPSVRLVAATHVSNALGIVNPVRELADAAHRAGAAFLLDAAQSVPFMPLDVTALDCDFAVFSGHKMLGPTGIGVLYGKRERLEAMPPPITGGDMVAQVSLENSTWADLPHRFEAGTPNIAGAIGLGEAVDYLETIGMENIEAHDTALAQQAAARLRALPGLRVFGPEHPSRRGGAVAFAMDGVHPHDVAHMLDQHGIAVRAGHLCAQPLMQHLGVPSVNRASFALYNTEQEIDRLIEGLEQTRRFFSHG